MTTAVAVTRSRPADGASAGGDVAVVRELPDGRVVLAVADIRGHGTEVAAAAAAVEATLADAAEIGLAPAYALALLDAQLSVRGEEEMATAAYAVLDARTGTAVCASAGHPPLLLVTEGYADLLPVDPGPPLGLAGRYADTTFGVAAGSVLVAYSDGLVERRGEDIDEGLARLVQAAAARGSRDVHDLVDGIFAALADDRTGDDVLITAVAVPMVTRVVPFPSPRRAPAPEGRNEHDSSAVRGAARRGSRGRRRGDAGRRRLREFHHRRCDGAARPSRAD